MPERPEMKDSPLKAHLEYFCGWDQMLRDCKPSKAGTSEAGWHLHSGASQLQRRSHKTRHGPRRGARHQRRIRACITAITFVCVELRLFCEC